MLNLSDPPSLSLRSCWYVRTFFHLKPRDLCDNISIYYTVPESTGKGLR